MIRALILLLFLAMPATAEEIVLGLSKDEVAISATFSGSEILIFGAVKRDAPAPPDTNLGVIITVSGPLTPITVRRKERRAGIWINTDAVNVDAAPSFYAVASSGPLVDVLREIEDLRNSITTARAIRSVGAEIAGSEEFTAGLIRIQTAANSYQMLEGSVDLQDETLFRTSISLPSNLTEGDYSTRIFLTRNGRVIDEYDTVIPVNKVGIERWLYDLAKDQALFYGLLSLVLAVSAGWAASAAFSALRR